MADARSTRRDDPAADTPATTGTPTTTDASVGEVGQVNVYDNDAADTTRTSTVDRTTDAPADRRTTYANTPAPGTRDSSPSLITWLIVLIAIVIVLYFVVQFLT